MGITSRNTNREGHEQGGPPSSRELLIGTTVGVFHGAIALLLWNFFNFENLLGMLSNEPLYLLYTLTGMFVLGFIPGLLYAKWESISPGLLVGGLLSLSSYGTWVTIGDGAVPVDPTPFGWYTPLWIGIAVLITVAGWIEVRFSR